MNNKQGNVTVKSYQLSKQIIPKKIIIVFLCIISFIYTAVAIAQQNKLINYSYLGEFSGENARLILQSIPPLETLTTTHSAQLYKIQYHTTAPDGSMTNASGLVAMPAMPKKNISIVSFHHGTRVTRTDVPSTFEMSYKVYPAIFTNSGGHMLVMPDYLGLGDNDLALHPYVHAETLASSSIDMIIAAKELAKKLNYPINDKLFLAGYSEGGFTTMVTYKTMLKDYKDIQITAVAPGSAPYDWLETVRFITQNPGPRATLYLAYFFYSMQTYHQYWNGLDVIFKKPYNTLIPVLLDGKHLINEILLALPSDPRAIMQDDFYDSIIDGSNPYTMHLVKNLNHYNFRATAPLMLIGSKGDLDLPYHGAEIAYENLKKQSDVVYIKHVSEVLDHLQAFPYVMKEQLEFFSRYEN